MPSKQRATGKNMGFLSQGYMEGTGFRWQNNQVIDKSVYGV
jgi:hypothetical protein